jgi:hypothetical protein
MIEGEALEPSVTTATDAIAEELAAWLQDEKKTASYHSPPRPRGAVCRRILSKQIGDSTLKCWRELNVKPEGDGKKSHWDMTFVSAIFDSN